MNPVESLKLRQIFIELSEEIFRELGFPLPSMCFDDQMPLAMEMHFAGRDFELIHSSTENPENILIYCFLGKIPDENSQHGLLKLLEANLNLARTYEAAYGVRAEDKFLCCIFKEPIKGLNAKEVLNKMQKISDESAAWGQQFFDVKSSITDTNFLGTQISLA